MATTVRKYRLRVRINQDTIQISHKIKQVNIVGIMKDSMVNIGANEDGILVNAKEIHITVQK